MKKNGLDFRPFRAWRYDSGRVSLSDAIAPPYDVISPAEREALYARSPFNVVRLILGKESNFYEHARECWVEWTKQGVLTQDPEPAFYLYEQAFAHPLDGRPLRRLALMGTLHLENAQGLVLPHEETFSGPKRDRFLLLEKTRTNLSPIFGLYPDSRRTLDRMVSSCRNSPPLFQAKEGQGILHQGWAVRKKEDQEALRELLSSKKILIADGHHRFETALEYRSKMREKFPKAPPDAPFDFVMMALVEFHDEGLLVLPTHRLIRSFGNFSSKKEFLDRLRQPFDFQPLPEGRIFPELNRCSPGEKAFGGIFGKEGAFLLRLKNPEAARKVMPPGKPAVWYEIETALLNHFIFKKLWGVPEKEAPSLLGYTHSPEEALRAVREGKAEAAFLLRATGVDTIQELADTGERMPQKTTYFYPKLASGLFFYHQEKA